MAPNPKWQVYEATSHSAPRPVRIPHWQVQEDHHSDTDMKALAHRLRGRRASRRDDAPGDETERSFRFEEAVKEDGGKQATTDRRDDNWRKNRGINSKTGSCNALAALATASTHATDDKEAVPPSFVNSPPLLQPQQSRTASASNMTRVESPQPHRHLNRANSNSRVNNAAAAAALRPNRAMTDVSSSSSSTQSSSSIGRSRSRHGGSMSSNASFLSVSNQKPEVVVDVRYSGYLAIKRGLLKVADKRYYFVARRNPELYSCKDETSFNLWLASGHPLDPHGGDGIAKASGLSPVLMGTVLRVDDGSGEEAGNGSNHSDKVFTVMVGSASKCFTLKFGAESGEKAMQWIEALQEVQVTKRNGTRHHTKLGSTTDKKMLLSLNEHNALRGTASEKSASNAEIVATDVVLLAEEGSEPVTRPASTSNAKMPRVYAGGKLQSKPLSVEEDEATAVSTPTSYTESSPTTSDHVEHFAPTTTSLPPSRLHRMDSVTSGSSTASGQSQSSNANGNVLLFVPVAGSSLTASASRMAKAQQELSALVAKGAKLPARVMQDPTSSEAIEWRYGVPQYVLTDLAYIKGRMREPDTTPLASYVEECCQTFIMEATHKARFDQWHSVIQNSFYLQVNDGVQVPGSAILENDMLGLLYLGDTGAGHGDSDDNQDPRAELAEAFPDGFPMEVLDVFTQPPQCYFSWRHWGAFTGKYRGVKGDGSKVEVRGFGEMTVDASRMRSLRLFFKQRDLISGLQQATDRIGRARRDTATISALNAGRTVRATSAAVAPVTQKEAVPNPKTSDIIEGLANFTLEAQEHQRKHTR